MGIGMDSIQEVDKKYSNEASFSLQGVIFAMSQNKIIHLGQLSVQRSSATWQIL